MAKSCKISLMEFTFADLQPTTLPKMSSFKVVFLRNLPTFLFFSVSIYLKEHIKMVASRLLFYLFVQYEWKEESINKKKQWVSWKVLSYFQFLTLRTPIIFFFVNFIARIKEIHKFITLSFLKTGLLIFGLQMWFWFQIQGLLIASMTKC